LPGRLSLLRTVGRAIRIVRAGGVVSGAAGLSGCGRPSVLRPFSAEAGALAWLTTVFFVMTLLVFAAVVLAVVAILLRHRVVLTPLQGRVVPAGEDRAPGRAVVVCGAATAVILAGLLWSSLGPGHPAERPPALVVEVVGHLWWWELRYLDPDGHARAVTANELHLPQNRTTRLQLQSADVIHSFWAPALGGKTDLVPGHPGQMQITPRRAGRLVGFCAEFCGLEHARMRLPISVDPPDAFEFWVAAQAAAGVTPRSPAERHGQELFMASPCVGCHAIRGTAAEATLGPDLTHLASRGTLATGTLANTTEHLTDWLAAPDRIKPGTLMPPAGMSGPDLNDLAAYLASLR
jgi:cytochrome c oxidase subunit 2